MRVLLADLDNTNFGNLALMKISAWHKARGDEVYLNFPLFQPDLTFGSCVFTRNRHRANKYPITMTIGGSGWRVDGMVLEPAIEHIMPDYSLYGLKHSVGFTSRGCIRRCPWCIVPQKEGDVQPWAEIKEFWNPVHSKIVLMDNNLLAAPNWRQTLEDLARERVLVDFNQGLDIRLIDEERAYWLGKVRTGRRLRFSFDEPAMEHEVRRGIRILGKAGIHSSRLSFYLLMGFDTAYEEDLDRISILQGMRCDYFAMRYQEVNGVKPRLPWGGPGRLEEFCRWINVKRLHRVMSYRQWLRFRGVPIKQEKGG